MFTMADRLRAEEAAQAREPDQISMDRVERAFIEYHEAKPWVRDRIVAMVRRYASVGKRRGIGFFFEMLRHEVFMASEDADGFKLNNNFRSRYARLIEFEHADLRGYFRKRRLRARIT